MAIRSQAIEIRSNVTGGPAARASFQARPALAALEAILLLVIVAAGLALWAGQAESARDRLRQALATEQLALLQEALTVYYLDQGAFPPGQPDLGGAAPFKALRALPSSNTLLPDWPTTAAPSPQTEPTDPWRSSYHYITTENDRWQQVANNGGWPFFVSPGPDRDFGGLASPAAEVDNRRTDELLAETPPRK